MSVVRSGDTGQGTCTGHKSPVGFTITMDGTAATVFVNGKPAVLMGDKGSQTCGHTGTANSGSSTVFIEGKPAVQGGMTGLSDAGGSFTLNPGSGDVNT